MLNRVDECRQRADECRRNAAQAVDDVLRGAYLDLARRWHEMAHQAQHNELGSFDTVPKSRADLRPSYSPAISRSAGRITQGINKLLAREGIPVVSNDVRFRG
jgi:hypothetical protein